MKKKKIHGIKHREWGKRWDQLCYLLATGLCSILRSNNQKLKGKTSSVLDLNAKTILCRGCTCTEHYVISGVIFRHVMCPYQFQSIAVWFLTGLFLVSAQSFFLFFLFFFVHKTLVILFLVTRLIIIDLIISLFITRWSFLVVL